MSPLGTKLIETRVFVVILVFSAVSGLNSAVAPYLSLFLYEIFGFSAAELGFFMILMSCLQFLISPILFFVVLYVTCGGPLLNRIASVLMSLIFGSLVGYLIGGFIGSIVVTAQREQLYPLLLPLSFLPQHLVSQTLTGFAVLAFSDINRKWRSALPVEELQKRRPVGVTLLAALYVIFALLNTVVAPVLTFYPSVAVSTRHGALAIIFIGVAFGLVGLGQLIVAAGLYYGRKWGWFAAVISCATSLVMDVYAFGAIVVFGGITIVPLLVLGSFVGFIINLAVLLYLLRVGVRKFFGLVNPPSSVQDESARTEES